MKLRLLIALSAYFLGTAAVAVAAGADPRPDMHALASEISAMQKFFLSDADFSSPANDAQIKKSLSSLSSHLDHLGKGTFAGDPSMKVNLLLLQQHVKDADRAFREDEPVRRKLDGVLAHQSTPALTV